MKLSAIAIHLLLQGNKALNVYGDNDHKLLKGKKANTTAKARKTPKAEERSKGGKKGEKKGEKKGGNIAIIGGGAAGLLSARELLKLGYEVTVYEASDRIGGLSTTIDFEGKRYDTSTVFMSSGDFETAGLTEEMSVLLHEAGLLNNVGLWKGDFFRLGDDESNIAPNFPASIAAALSRSEGQDVLDELFTGLATLEHIVKSGSQGVAATEAATSILAGETLNNWADRTGAGYLRDILGPATDVLMGGPAGNASAAYLLNQRSRLGPSLVVNVILIVMGSMGAAGQEPSLVAAPVAILPLIARGLYPSWIAFDEQHGFQGFWEDLAAAYSLNVHIESPVEHLVVHAKGIDVKVSKVSKTTTHDAVVLATPPYATSSILSKSTGLSPVTDALTADFAAIPRDHSVVTVAFKANFSNLVPAGFGAVIIAAKADLNTPMSIGKAYANGNVQITGLYASDRCGNIDLAEYGNLAIAHLEDKLKVFNYTVNEIVNVACFDAWPYRPSIDQMTSGFLDRIELAQGQDGIVFTGELLTGAGIPSIAQYTADLIPTHFSRLSGKKSSSSSTSDSSSSSTSDSSSSSTSDSSKSGKKNSSSSSGKEKGKRGRN